MVLQKLKPLLPPQPMAELTGALKQFDDALPLLETDPRFERVADNDRYNIPLPCHLADNSMLPIKLLCYASAPQSACCVICTY